MVIEQVVSQRAHRAGPMTALVLLWLFCAPAPAQAHEIRPAVIDLQLQADGGYRVAIRLNLEALLAGIGVAHRDSDDSENAPRYNRLRRLPPAELRREFLAFEADFLRGLDLRADGDVLPVAMLDLEVPPVGDTDLARDSVVQLGGALGPGVRQLTWRWDARFGASVLRVDAGDGAELYTAYLQPGAGSEPVTLDGAAAQSPWTIAGNYLVIGFAHIVPKGADHILFVVGLFLLSPGWRPLLWQVTAFTLAHTVTLALSMLGWVNLPASIVEPLIAASIVYVCVENLFQERLTRWRPAVVFGFGLLHGLGFAGVLTDVGLSPGHFVMGLVAFNLGVELGQLTILALCFLLVGLWFRDRPWYRRAITMPASLVIALVGAFWFVDRTLLA